jgi:hypothetical protein
MRIRTLSLASALPVLDVNDLECIWNLPDETPAPDAYLSFKLDLPFNLGLWCVQLRFSLLNILGTYIATIIIAEN